VSEAIATGERAAWVYLLECADGTLYTGWCYDVEARLREHNGGRGARYTSGRRPVTLRWQEEQPGRSAAMRREFTVKRLSRRAKLRLIEHQQE
jgi:putative endonuclease